MRRVTFCLLPATRTPLPPRKAEHTPWLLWERLTSPEQGEMKEQGGSRAWEHPLKGCSAAGPVSPEHVTDPLFLT